MGSTQEEYDFIIVGGIYLSSPLCPNFLAYTIPAGPSGSVLASRLARTKQAPSILLVEAGGPNTNVEYTVPADRFALAFSQPTMNWGYKTAPQSHLKNREIDYSRGKGLGGSTAINFSCWILGPKDDYDEWAELTGDDAWRFDGEGGVKERLKRVENYHVEVKEEYRKFINPKSEVNDGNPLGLGMGAGCMYAGARTTSSCYLQDPPSNLTIIPDTPIHKVLLSDSKSATGILTTDGREFHAKKEVILSAGIGPRDQLQKHNIPLLHELPEIGKNLQDHAFCGASIILQEGTNERMKYERDLEGQMKLREQHRKDKTGFLNSIYCSNPMGFFKNDRIVRSEEFKALDERTQKNLMKPTVPHFEICTHTPPLYLGEYNLKPTDSYLAAFAFVMNPQARGSVSLASSDPRDPPTIDANLINHPYDRRVLIEGMRELLKLLRAPVLQKNTIEMVGGPNGESDDEIWAWAASSWHMCSTVKMGKPTDASARTTRDFRLKGVRNLRVVDLSVMPLLPTLTDRHSNHTQSTAYLVGELAAEKMAREYGLDEIPWP
ncbi:glucose-methanol-choline oxidoreductase-like protein [Amylocarpus encephaloides]|uniref:Glucose-methanol-choline oxidoreductase-like protein n=1 Tax=Amylocarpus encephaloides TaxID=45428 RepID=A0A9P8C5E9_9HELO|nr:glucose-methanol-choline oxidoreductase-like protein [Amylocarpus encephaloides]